MDFENMYDFLDNYEKENYSEENMGIKDNKITLTKLKFFDENNEEPIFNIFQIKIMHNKFSLI